MLHQLSLDANSIVVLANIGIGVYKYILFGERILLDFDTRDVGLSNSMVRPMKLKCVFNKVFLVNHWHDILNCSCKWLCFSNVDPKP